MRFVRSYLAVVVSLVLVATVAGGSPVLAAKTPAAPAASFTRFDLTTGTRSGVALSGGSLVLGAGLASGTYADPFGAAIAEEFGTWTSTSTDAPFDFDELVASWNARTPDGTWISVEMQASGSGRTTKWYTMGIWASGDGTIHRTSVGGQGDADGFIAIDTFIRSKKAATLSTYRLKVTLHRAVGLTATPAVRFVGAMTSADSTYAIPSAFTGVAANLAVPRFSQEIHAGEFPEYDGGGEAWCSPTSTAMVLAYWGSGPNSGDLVVFPGTGHTDPQVDFAARYTYDYHYQGAGNWPFNTAYASSFGSMHGFVTRLRSLAEAERFIAAGIPLIASIQGKLEGFLFKKTSGHLLVIRGFTASGDVIANDPAVMSDADVEKTYGRADFENAWLGGSAGIVYVIYPDGVSLPPTVSGPPPNW